MYSQDINITNYAGFPVRLVAYFIDHIILFIVLAFIKLPMWFISLAAPDFMLFKPVLFKFSTFDIILYLLTVTYFVLTVYYTGTTLGKRLFNLKVVSSSNEKLNLLNLIYRETIGRYLSGLLFLGYILIIADKRKRGLHDILCDTFVVYSFNRNTGIYPPNVEIKPLNNFQEDYRNI